MEETVSISILPSIVGGGKKTILSLDMQAQLILFGARNSKKGYKSD